MYGITETTVHVTYRPLSNSDLNSGSVIGVPIPDLKIYILDPQLRPVPVGVSGEMYVGGAGLARGYLNRPELTAQRFIPDHLTGQPGHRLYRTGDVARFLASHDIEYLGRIDDQVKIRGFRIELGEIESVLCEHEAVREAAVVAREDVPGTKRLVAYLVSRQPNLDVSALRDHLKRKLPDYMVPAAFAFLDKLPLTSSGKVDRRALPVPEYQRVDLANRYVAPRTEVERKLVAIWSKVLRIDRAGVRDNFFELGGDSILSLQVISMARGEGLKLTPKLLFEHPTIAELAMVAAEDDDTQSSHEVITGGDVPLTPIQLWFLEQHLDEASHYNQAFLFEVTGRIERPVLERALQEVSRHHDALRLRFAHEDSGWRQYYAALEESAPLSWVDLSDCQEPELQRQIDLAAASAQGSLDLEHGPLWRVSCFDLGPERAGRLLFVVHHLAVDGVSWRPLLEDLEAAYQQSEAGRGVRLAAKTTSFKVWAERLKELAATRSIRDEVAYWKTVADPEREAAAALPVAHPEAVAEDTEGSSDTLMVSLSVAETQALIQRVPSTYNTQINDVLLTAIARAWDQCTGSRVLYTNVEGHGRESLFDDVDLSRTVGWFTSIFPVRLRLPGSGIGWKPGEALKSVKEQLRRVPRHGIGYGILRYLAPEAEMAAWPEPEMVFNYLGQFDQVFAGSEMFRVAAGGSGPWHSPRQHRRYRLEINSLVSGGQLEVRWTYNSCFHPEAAIRRLADECVAALREVIHHCQSPEAGGYTPSDFPLAQLDQSTLDRLVGAQRDVEDIYPLSPIQTLFYSTSPGPVQSGFDQWHCTFRGDLNVPALQDAWRETLRRHPILRSSIHDKEVRHPIQVVHRHGLQLPWTIEDWRGTPAGQLATRWSRYLEQDRAQPLTLTDAPVMRFALVQFDDQTWKFLWSIPALLLDGWSWPLVFRDVSRLYEAYAENLEPQLEPARPYRDYVRWNQQHASSEAEEFWRKVLDGYTEPTPLVGDSPDSLNGGARYQEISVHLSAEVTGALQSTARRLQTTLNTMIQGAWALLLGRHSRRDDVLFGSAFAGRPTELPGVESIVGPFVNSLPVRVMVDKEATISTFLRHLHRRLLEMSLFQFTSMMDIQRVSQVPWQYRLFDSVIVFQNYLIDDTARRLGAHIEIAAFSGPIHTNYPLMLIAEPGTTLRLTLIYDCQRMARTTIERWGRDLAILLERMVVSTEVPVGKLQALLSPPADQPHTPRRRLSAESQNYVPPQTAMEQAIVDLWQKLLGVARVGVEENFFDLGGHSLLLVRMHNQLREMLKVDFPIVTFFEHPTVRSLARYLDQPADSPAQVVDGARDRAQRQMQALKNMRSRIDANKRSNR